MLRLTTLRREKGISMRKTAEMLEIPYTTYRSYETGDREPNSEMLITLAAFFNCSIDYLIGNTNIKTPYGDKPVQIATSSTLSDRDYKLIERYHFLDGYGREAVDAIITVEYNRCKSSVIELPKSYLKSSAGSGEWLEEESTTTVTVRVTPEATRADIIIPVSGDSMSPKFNDGDCVLVRRQPDIEIGEIGIFIVDNHAYIKQKGNNKLISLNREYKDITGNEFSDSRCFGKVLGIAEIIDE